MFAAVISNKAVTQWLVLGLLVIMCWWRGAGPERASVSGLMIFGIFDPIYHWVSGRGVIYGAVDVGHLTLDCIVGGLFLAIAMRANRIYPLWLAGFQMIAVLSHVGRDLSTSSAPLAYSILTFLPSYLIITTLCIGLASHILRTARFGPYQAWWNDCPPWKAAPRGGRVG